MRAAKVSICCQREKGGQKHPIDGEAMDLCTLDCRSRKQMFSWDFLRSFLEPFFAYEKARTFSFRWRQEGGEIVVISRQLDVWIWEWRLIDSSLWRRIKDSGWLTILSMLGCVKKEIPVVRSEPGGFGELSVGSKRWSSTSRSPHRHSTHTQKMRKFVFQVFRTWAIQLFP